MSVKWLVIPLVILVAANPVTAELFDSQWTTVANLSGNQRPLDTTRLTITINPFAHPGGETGWLEIRGAPSWTGGTLIVDPTGSFVNPFNSCCGDGHFAWLTQRDLSGKIAFHLSLRDRPGNTAEIVSVAAGVTVPPPPPPSSGGSLTVALTSPKAAPSVTTGTVAVNVWCEGCAAGTNVYTLTVDGQQLTTQSCACLHVWPGWNTKTVLNGTHTLTATIRDSAGKGGSTSLTVLVNNG